MNPIGSAATVNLSSPHLLELRDLIATAHARHSEAEVLVAQHQSDADAKMQAVARLGTEVKSLQGNLNKWKNSRLRFFHGRKIRKAERRSCELVGLANTAIADLATARAALQDAEDARDESWLDGTFPLNGPASAAWETAAQAFQQLSRSAKIWDLTAERDKRAGAERSAATSIFDRKPTQLSVDSLPFFAPEFSALRWHNANGDDLYLYPGLLLVVHSASDFAVIDVKSLKMSCEPVRFIESEEVPADSNRIDSSWQYSNRDGTRDLRYRENEEYPVMLYGEFRFKSATGLNEGFMFSNASAIAAFSDAMREFEKQLSR